MKTTTRAGAALAALAFLGLGLASGSAGAAGGHHAVDDAALLEAGHCGPETWWTHGQDGTNLLHAGVNCRVGPVELGGATEHAHGPGGSQTAWNLEVKWARELFEGFSVGIDVQPGTQPQGRPRFDTTKAVALATWQLAEPLKLHLNLGRDFIGGGGNQARGGVALEWAPTGRWSLLAERYLEGGTHYLRGGVRWAPSDAWSLDFSRAQRLGGPAPSTWTVGLNYDFSLD